MSIATRTGDQGTTGMMYNRRAAKCHPRVEALGCVDELNAAIGVARATSQDAFTKENLLLIQQQLITVMGELATTVEDLLRYVTDGFNLTEPCLTARLDAMITEMEANMRPFKGWALPGENMPSAFLDMARAICRRAERNVCKLHEDKQLRNQEIIVYLNRLADVLWLMARRNEPA